MGKTEDRGLAFQLLKIQKTVTSTDWCRFIYPSRITNSNGPESATASLSNGEVCGVASNAPMRRTRTRQFETPFGVKGGGESDVREHP